MFLLIFLYWLSSVSSLVLSKLNTSHRPGKDNFSILMDLQVLPLAREGEILNYL
jgi:hypothetical protein